MQVFKWVQNWVCKINFLGARPALRYIIIIHTFYEADFT